MALMRTLGYRSSEGGVGAVLGMDDEFYDGAVVGLVTASE
jgi:hypothetical protein